ncbi:tyrosine--tRNA ligase [Candidatus Parcubacteria bacterium]|uniref:Tyrosine--tRNA ligase n=1 Tax=Candidatus Kaiserbacteria bacterium CG10_big_fil_rev_8_21_14_0_10_47_16 TaxID=1974608 RepID=A0A2H0UDZ5_9BACT|nr:tyrosine--tRNA ligase [Candidatus Parcubacteria bacterium]PIR84622.1 MAG: tyrosine--tRNA ligase [Candidatus Kaiserbacteria bacterium CG10_big_fil_rev_8_21_14_0_10_47_16]
MKIDTDPIKINELLTRGVAEIIHEESLRKKLESGKQLRIKLGIDPTSPNIHIGRAIPLLKLRDFQELGHQVVFIVGDFTSVIGDTSDKDSERPMLDRDVIEANKKTYFAQVGKILDLEKAELRYNSEWLEELTYREIGEHADVFSVADFIARDNIKRRLDSGKRVSLREVLYPLMQGYDSVAVEADVEIGGTDQRFNLLAGRTLQPRFDQKPQDILMSPLINGTDGRKMSSSWGNTINLVAEPEDMYGSVMSMADAEIVGYFTTCTRVPLSEVKEIEEAMQSGTNPRDLKMRLAREIVTMYHGEKEAKEAEQAFVETFQKGGVPEEVEEISGDYTAALLEKNMVASKTELRRLFEAGGVRNAETGEKYDEFPTVTEPTVLKIGKRRFVKLLP